MGVLMKKASEKSSKTITLDRSRLKQEMSFHPGSGVNQTCIYDDVAKLLGYSHGKTLNNKKFSFTSDEVDNLCAAWGVRSEYLQGLDDWRTQQDYDLFLMRKFAFDIKSQHVFFDSLDIKHDFVIFALCPKEKWLDSFSSYFYFWNEKSEMYYIKMTSTEMVEIFDNNYLLDIDMFYVLKTADDEIIKMINQETWRKIINVLRENAIKGFYDSLALVPGSFENDKIDE